MYKYLFIDFDGTIADSVEQSYLIYNELAERFKVNRLSLEEVKELRRISTDEALKRVGLTNYFQILRFFYKAKKEQGKRIAKIKPFEDFTQFLDKVSKQKDIRIFTSNSKENVEKFLAHYNMTFVKDVISCKGLFKKDKKILKYLKKNKISAEDVLYIGDENRDIISCKKAKIDIASVCWGYHDKDLLERFDPDYLIEKTEDFEKILDFQK